MKGTDNEFQFVLALNNKKVKELNPLLRQVIDDIYYDINEEDIIKAWRNHKKQKADILLNINGIIKGISIKLGSRNSVHVEHIGEFCDFLYKLGASKDIVLKYISFHYADGTLNGRGIIRQSTEQYKKLYHEDIQTINKFLNTPKNMSSAIERFVLKGNNSDYEIDGIIYGTPDDFLWLKKFDIIRILMFNYDDFCSTIHFGSLVCQPLNRCLNYNTKYSYGRYYVQIKWYSLFDDIIESMYCSSYKQVDNVGSIPF